MKKTLILILIAIGFIGCGVKSNGEFYKSPKEQFTVLEYEKIISATESCTIYRYKKGKLNKFFLIDKDGYIYDAVIVSETDILMSVKSERFGLIAISILMVIAMYFAYKTKP